MSKCPWCGKRLFPKLIDQWGECHRLDCRQSRARASTTWVPNPEKDFFEERKEIYEMVNRRVANTKFEPK